MKRVISAMLAITLLIALIPQICLSAEGTSSFPNSLYLTQQTNSTCTLSSAAMMLRSRMYLSGNNNWSSITESSIRSVAWVTEGLKWEWTYNISGNSMSVKHNFVSGISVSALKNLLNSHPEGVVLYCGNYPHAVFLTDYEGDTFYCADPAGAYSGSRRTLTSSMIGNYYGNQSAVLNNVTAYWYVSSYSISMSEYTVSFEGNGGSSLDSITVSSGESITIPTTIPTRFGYNFLGWSTSTTSLPSYYPGDKYTPADSVTLYASWVSPALHVDEIQERYEYSKFGQGRFFSITVADSGTYKFEGLNESDLDTRAILYDSSYNQLASNDDGAENLQFSIEQYLYADETYLLWVAPYYSVEAVMHFYITEGVPVFYSGATNTNAYRNAYNEYLYTANLENGVENEGYTLTGWSTTQGASEAEYAPYGLVEIIVDEPHPSQFILYPVWKPTTVSGTCGDNVTWWMAGGKLVVSGTGAMTDFASKEDRPWNSFEDEIGAVVVQDGVTHIGQYAFQDFDSMYHLSLPDTLTTIGPAAFESCDAIQEITIPVNVTLIDKMAFSSCSELTTVTMHENVATIGLYAFQGNAALQTVYYCGTEEQWNSIYIRTWNEPLQNARVVTSLESNSVNSAEISSGGAIKYYSFTPTENGKYVICSTGSDDTYVTLYDTDSNQIAYDDDGGENRNFCLEYALSTGTTYIYAVRYYGTSATGTISFNFSRKYSNACGDNLTWTLVDGVLTISGTGAMYDYGSGEQPWYDYRHTITELIVENGVTTIGDQAFEELPALNKISLPETLKTIGAWAFYECTSLTAVTIPNSITEIDYAAFYNCTNLNTMTISDGVQSFGGIWVDDCNIQKLIIADGATLVDSKLIDNFYKELRTVVISDTVTTIDDDAFYECTNLTTVTIGDSVTTIGDCAFENCTSLTAVTIPDSVTTIGNNAFENCTSLTAVTIGDSVAVIGISAFDNCTGLTSIIIPDSITTIGDYAFCWCDNLTDVHYAGTKSQWSAVTIGTENDPLLAATLHTIQPTLQSISVKSTPTKTSYWIGESLDITGLTLTATYNDGSTKTVSTGFTTSGFNSTTAGTKTVTVTYEGMNATFTVNVEEVVTTGTCGDNLTWMLSSNGILTISGTGTMFDYDYGTAPWYEFRDDIIQIIIEEGVTTIGNYAFVTCLNLCSVAIPEGLTTVGRWAFINCHSIDELFVPDSVEYIGRQALSNLGSLRGIWVGENNSVYSSDASGVLFNKDKTLLIQAPGGMTGSYDIPDSVVGIGEVAFDLCYGLTSVTIPDTVTIIGDGAFGKCGMLSGIWVEENNPVYASDAYGVLFNKDKSMLIQAPGGITGSYDIPKSVTEIDAGAFEDCRNLTAVTIPDTVEEIRDSTFAYCTGLTSITIPDGISSVERTAFDGCTNLAYNIYGNGKYLGSKSNPYFVIIGTESDSTTSVKFHSDAELIANGAFWECTNLKNVSISDGITSISRFAFYDCSSLMEINIPDSVTAIGHFAFYGCESLTEILIPSSVTSLGLAVFYDCTALTEVVVPDGITKLGDNMFANCTGLTSVYIPDSVTEIGGMAFYNCASLTDVYYSGTAKQWDVINISAKNEPLAGAMLHTQEETGNAITRQPEATCVDSGETVQFSVAVQGNVLSYKWQYRKIYKWFDTSMEGYNTDTLQVPATGARNGYDYRCVITFADGTVLYSEPAELTVNTYITEVQNPNDQTVVLGYKGQFTASAQGEGLKYQWQYQRPDGERWIDTAMEGATKPTVYIESTTARDGYMYRCMITDVTGKTVYTEAATMQVLSFVAHPVETFAATGDTATFMVLTNTASGFTYQWQYSRNGGASWSNTTLPGYNTSILEVEATKGRNGYLYRCVLTGSKNSKIESKAAALHVGDPVEITAQPEGVVAEANSTVTFEVTATNVYSYQWQYARKGSDTWQNTSLTGCTTDTLSVEVLSSRNGYRYRCVITGLDGKVYYTNAASLIVG